jgi:hypothetical protein
MNTKSGPSRCHLRLKIRNGLFGFLVTVCGFSRFAHIAPHSCDLHNRFETS